MSTVTLQDVEHAVRAAWGVEICEDPADVPHWSPDDPSRGQCGPTALVVHDLFGGQLCVAQVHVADGTSRGVHWWNRLPGGLDVDLTRDQFRRGEVVAEPRVLARPEGRLRRGEEQYRLLRRRVYASLGIGRADRMTDRPGGRPGLRRVRWPGAATAR